MAANSLIEWTSHTFNPWWGCTKVSPACDNCYAEAWAKRTGHAVWGARAPRRLLSEQYWQQPLRWDNAARESGRRARVFCASMADVFEWGHGLAPLRRRLWRLIDDTPDLDWLLLTKRPHLVARLAPWGDDEWPPHVWVGTTVETQRFAAKRLPALVEVPCRYRFVSCEPLLGPLDLSDWIGRLQWIIAGGESGGRARPMDPAWLRGVRDQCQSAGVAFHFKQWGNWLPAPSASQEFDQSPASYVRMGKKTAGRTLDGRTWDQLPHGYSDRNTTGLGRSRRSGEAAATG